EEISAARGNGPQQWHHAVTEAATLKLLAVLKAGAATVLPAAVAVCRVAVEIYISEPPPKAEEPAAQWKGILTQEEARERLNELTYDLWEQERFRNSSSNLR
ncbi:MAG: hypothetical protein U0790_17810, partial [Isosphaeraceae bacterium]